MPRTNSPAERVENMLRRAQPVSRFQHGGMCPHCVGTVNQVSNIFLTQTHRCGRDIPSRGNVSGCYSTLCTVTQVNLFLNINTTHENQPQAAQFRVCLLLPVVFRGQHFTVKDFLKENPTPILSAN